MDEQLSVQGQPPAPPASEAPPATNAQPTGDSAGPDVAGLSPDQANAFSKKWQAERTKLEQSMRAQMEAEYQQRMMPPPPPPPPPPSEENDTEELATINSELLTQFYDNPLQAMQRAQEVLAERKGKREQAVQAQWDYHAQVLARKYQDWGATVPKIQEILKDNPDLVERPEHLERAYRLAKAYSPVDPESYWSDPSYVASAKERLRAEIVQEYVTNKKGAAPPPIMGGAPGGTPPAMPPQQPRTWADARLSAMHRQR